MRTFAIAVVVLVACTPPPPGPPRTDAGPAAECPLSTDAKKLVEHRVNQLLRDVSLVGTHMRDSESAYALNLVAEDEGQAGFAFLIAPCTERSQFDPYCEPLDFEEAGGDQLCLRLACEGAGILLSHAWLAQADHTAPDDDHVLTRATTIVPGTATYDPNPLLTWRADTNDPNDVPVAARIDWNVSIETAAGETIDASHTGEIASRRVGVDEELSATLDLMFPGLAASGAIDVAATVDHTGLVSGSVAQGDVQVGALAGPFDDEAGIAVTWSALCTDDDA